MTRSQWKTAAEVFKNGQNSIQHRSASSLESLPQEKTFKLTANIYTIAFTAFLVKNKEQFRMKSDDQMDLLYRALFMAAIQLTFLYMILVYEDFGAYEYKDDTLINLCLFFTMLLLHWSSLPEARNGIYMMKHVLCHPDQYTHPFTAFCIGLLHICTCWLCEVLNLVKSLNHKKPKDVISKFVGFATVLAVPKIMISSMEQFEQQKCVKDPLKATKGRKMALSEPGYWMKLPIGAILHPIYWIFKRAFTGFYFYFFPFVVILIPMFKLTYLANVQ